jgi:hypothetical protein
MAFPLAALIPSALGVIGSLFGGKGKKAEYAAQQTPQQQMAYKALLNMIQQRMGQQSAGFQPTFDAMNNLSQMFYGKEYAQPQAQPGPVLPNMTPRIGQQIMR